MIGIEIQICKLNFKYQLNLPNFNTGKLSVKDLSYHKELSTTATCNIRAAEEIIQDKEALTLLIANAQFDSVKAVAAAATRGYEAIY